MDSKIGLLIQLNGVFLITALSLVLRRSVKLTALKYWTVAWLCESFALISLRLAFDYPQLEAVLLTYFYLGEYLFIFMLVAGIRSLDSNFEIQPRNEFYFLPLVALSIALPIISADFNELLPYHSFVLAVFCVFAVYLMQRGRPRTFGWHLMRVALGMLAINHAGYIGLFLTQGYHELTGPALAIGSIVNLVLQSLLGLGMVIVLLERVLSDYKNENAKLRESHKRLEELVHIDPLTAAFNRHSFYGFVNKGDDISGCVGFFDIDELKAINDCFGHAVGDMAIRHVAASIRSIIRAEDLIYRWGGDEFFVIMLSMDAAMAETRMTRLNAMLRDVVLPGVGQPMTIGVSWGFRNFYDSKGLETATVEADAEMYRRKKQRKTIDELGPVLQPAGDVVLQP